MQLLIIDGIDFSKYINDSTYKVSSQSVYEEWKDANYKKHRQECRSSIEGSFDMVFTTDAEYDAFLSHFKGTNMKQMTVYVGGSVNRMIESYFFFDMSTSRHEEINKSTSRIFNKISVKLEEQ